MLLDDGVDDLPLVFVVDYFPVAIEADEVTRFPQQAQSQRMERGDVEPVGVDSGQRLDPGLHFVGSLVGEGHAENVPGLHSQPLDGVGDLVGDDPGFARAGAGHDQQRGFEVEDGLLLPGIEVFEDVNGHRCRG